VIPVGVGLGLGELGHPAGLESRTISSAQ